MVLYDSYDRSCYSAISAKTMGITALVYLRYVHDLTSIHRTPHSCLPHFPFPSSPPANKGDVAKVNGNILAAPVFSIKGTPTTQPCSPACLTLPLRVHEPGPQTLLLGGDYSDVEVADPSAVFREYAEEVRILNGAVVIVRQGVVLLDG